MRPLQSGDDHNLLSNRSRGDPHPQYATKALTGVPGGTLPPGTYRYQVLVWDGSQWIPDVDSQTGEPLITIDAGNGGVTLGGYQAPSEPVHVLGGLLIEASVAWAGETVSSTPFDVDDQTTTYMTVDTSVVAITINLPIANGTFRSYIIKDNPGNAAVRNITIVPDGSDTIEGQASVTLSDPYASIWLVSDGTSNWSIITGYNLASLLIGESGAVTGPAIPLVDEPVTNGDPDDPEMLYLDGDVVMMKVF